jgi:thioesterase domain-containing protein
LAERIEAESNTKFSSGKKAWTYLCELQRGKDRKPVFVFPGGGGGEPEFFVYGFLARHVGAEYPFYGLRVRGADGVLKPHGSVAQMADAYVEEIRAIQPEGPYFLVGECAGGVTAYEAARQLLAQGQEVAMLVLMDVERPTLTKYLRFRAGRWLEPVNEILDDTVWSWWRENYYLTRLPHHLRQLRSLALSEYPSYVAGRITGTLKPPEKKRRPIDSRRERAEIVLYTTASGDALRHIEWVRENYRRTVRRFHPKPYNGHIEIIVSEKLSRRDPTLGWKNLALKGLGIHPVPGDHWTYIRGHVAVAGPTLRECLEKAEPKSYHATHSS